MNILSRALRDRRVPLTWWTVGLVVYCVVIVAVWPVLDGNDEIADLYADMPEALQAMFGAEGFTEFTTPAGFLNTYLYSMILPFIFTGLAVSLGASMLAGEEEDGLLDLVLSHPIRRRRLLLEKVLAMIVALTGVAAVSVVFLTISREPVDLDVGVDGLVIATAGSALFGLVHGLLALGAGAWRGSKGMATGIGWGVALTGYLVNIVANLDDSLDWLAPLSPLHWATSGSPVTGEVPAGYLALAAAAGLVATVATLAFERHDLT